MDHVYATSIRTAQEFLSHTSDAAHDLDHAQRVALNVRAICHDLDYPGQALLEVCAWWHDVGRLFAENHEELSAMLLWNDLYRRGASFFDCEAAFEAICYHRWNMQPRTLAGLIIRDADKLDFLAWERWQKGIEAGQWRSIRRRSGLMSQLRNLLSLGPSKQLYDQRIDRFELMLNQSRSSNRLAPEFA